MATFQPRTRKVRIFGGDYDARLAELATKIIAASSDSNGPVHRMGGTPENVRLAKEYEDLRAEAIEQATLVTVEQLRRGVAKALRKAHPPRKAGVNGATERDERNDAVLGVNEETFKEALVRGGTVTIDGREVEYRSVVDPDMEEDDWEALSEGSFQKLYTTALDLNFGFVADPKEISPAWLETLANAAS